MGGEYTRNNESSRDNEMQGPYNEFESRTGEAKATSVFSLVQTGIIVQVSTEVWTYDV